MNYPSAQQRNTTKSLPPALEQLSSFEFGKLVIQLNIEELIQLNITKFQIQFLGGKSPVYQCTSNKKTFEFPIKTTLWHFYSYLKDMGSIFISFESSSDHQQMLVCQKELQLLPMSKVMTKNYVRGNYIANSVELCDIHCSQTKQSKGYVMFKVKLQFDEQIHREVRDVVNFEQILSKNPEETNQLNTSKLDELPSQSQLIYQNYNNFQTSKQAQLLADSKEVRSEPHQYNFTRGNQNASINSNLQNLQSQFNAQYSDVKNLEEDESRMIEDDIDRLISEMQNKPYDSSRYLDSQQSLQQQQIKGIANSPYVNPIPFSPQDQFTNTQRMPYYPSSQMNSQNSFIPSINEIPTESRMNRFHPHDQMNLTQQSGRSQHNSRSPINNSRKYPPVPLPNNNNSRNFTQQQSFMPQQTIYSQHSQQRSVSPMNNSRNRSLTRTQQLFFPHSQSTRNLQQNNSLSMTSSQAAFPNPNNNRGTLKIQIHQLLGRQLDPNQFLLRIYANNDYEELMNCKGYQEGQVIVYNQKAQLKECDLSGIEKLRFELENYQGVVVYSCVFQMGRLINIPKLEGIFMLNLIPHNHQFYGSQVTASQTILKKLSTPPSAKTLRTTISFTQELQVIQIYLNLSLFSLPFSKCKYKIPLTKETVEFQSTETHFNIFPHSKAFPKLVIEFWDEKAIMGVCEVNLSQIKNITKNVLECNLEPIYLYDTVMPVKNIFTQNQVGKFKLLVCCGNVRQVQHVLNKTMLNRSISMTEMAQSTVSAKTMVEVEYDKKLGVFVKDRKQKSEIEIQVDEKELKKENLGQKQSLFGGDKNNKGKKTQEEDYHEVSMLSQNQFLATTHEKELVLSKVHSIKLSQQEIQDDEDDEDVKKLKHKPSPQFNKKKSQNVEIVPTKTSKVSSSVQSSVKQSSTITQSTTPSPPLKPFNSLQSIICSHIKSSFQVLSSLNFEPYQELKRLCKSHLLFNFLDIDILIKQMMQLGINKGSISQILQILQPLNGMVNFNLLNDFMMCLQVEEEIKYNLVPGKLFVKMALEQYYRLSCEQIQKQQWQFNPDFQSDQKQWLSSKFLNQIATLDESIDFNETRKLFSQLSIKISMNEYTLLKNFLQNQKEIKTFLFEMAESKSSYEQMIKGQKNLFEVLKLCVIEGLIRRRKEQELDKKYEEGILDKLYSSKMFQKSLNESNISYKESESNMSELRESRMSEYGQGNKYEGGNEFAETRRKFPVSRKQEGFTGQNDSFMPKMNAKPYAQSHYEEQDDDDFITMALNTKPSPKQEQQKSKLTKKNHQFSDDESSPQQPTIPTRQYKSPPPSVSLSQTGQTLITYSTIRTITLSGLSDCKTTCQCQLDMELQLPFIKVSIESPYEKKLYFKESDQSHTQQFQVKNEEGNDDEEIEGTVTLSDVTKKGDVQVAAARFVVIKGIQSVYALKTLREDTFCGLVKIIIE